MTIQPYTKDRIKQSILGKLQRYYGKTLEEATPYQQYYAVASTVRDQIMDKWILSREIDQKEGGKRQSNNNRYENFCGLGTFFLSFSHRETF